MPIKLTQKQISDLLKAAGVADVEVVADDKDSDFALTENPVTQDSLLTMVDAARKPIIQTVIQGEIHSKVSGTINNALRKQLSELTGVPIATIEGKESKDAMKLAFDHWATTAGGDKEAHATKIKELLAAHKVDKDALNTDWETRYNAEVKKLTEKEIIDALVAEHNAAKGLPPTANKALLAKQFKTHLDSVAVAKVNPATGKIELFDKTSPDQPLLNTAKTAQVQVGDLIKLFYKDLGIWNEDTRSLNAIDQMNKIDLNAPKNSEGKPISTLQAQTEAVNKWTEVAST